MELAGGRSPIALRVLGIVTGDTFPNHSDA